jgi:hypothetical protein
MYMCPIPNGFRDKAISLYSFKIVDKKAILRTTSNSGIYRSSEKVGTVCLLQYIFENSTFNINALYSSCEDMLASTAYSVLYSEMALSRKPLGIGHMYIYTFCLE